MTTPRGEDDGAKEKRRIINPGRGRNDRRILDLGEERREKREERRQESGDRRQTAASTSPTPR